MVFSAVLLAAALTPDSVCLSNRHGHAEIALHGAFVMHYVPAGGSEVVAEPKPFFGQADKALLVGGIPLCWPWFVNQGPKGAPPNGLTRYQIWRVKGRENADERSVLDLEVDDDEWTRSVWNHGYHAEMRFVLDERLSIRFAVTNTGTDAMKCNDGFHSYFRVGDAHRCTVEGTDGLPYFNRGEADLGFTRRWRGDFRVGEMRYGYAFLSGPHEFRLVDPVMGRTLIVSYSGVDKSCIWNPGTQNAMFAESWRGFVCVEGANLYDSGVYELAPGARHEVSMTVGVERVHVADARGISGRLPK